MAERRTTHLLTLTLSVTKLQALGATPSGSRRVGPIAGGIFEGPRLRGIVLPDGADWIIGGPDGSNTLDVRPVPETHDKATTGMTYRGMRHDPAADMQRVNRGAYVDPSEYCFRTSVALDTAALR
jgi:hypothetical protein